jgi:hypothetical protein
MKKIFRLKNKKNNKIYVIAKSDEHAREIGVKNRRAICADMFTSENITDAILTEFPDLHEKLPNLNFGILVCRNSGNHRIWKSYENCY